MKKAGILLVVITVVFSAFAGGYFIGRNANHRQVQVSKFDTPTQSTEAVATAEKQPDTVVNINTADIAQLSTLPGIGPVLAQRIIDYREQNGDFSDPAELGNVSGIGEKRLEVLLEYITVGG